MNDSKSEYDVPSLQNAVRRRRYLVKLWTLIKPYWFAEDRWAGRGLLLLVIALTLAVVYLNVLIADWNRLFFNAIQAKNYQDFMHLLIRFGILAALYIFFAAYAIYFNQMLQIRWRRWLTEQYYRDWLSDRSYYLLQLENSEVENPEQRIQDDIGIVTTMTLDLGIGLLNSVVTLASFLMMLWYLSGTLNIHVAGFKLAIPGYMVWMAVVYSALGTVATHFVGRPLIRINYDLQRYDADFRFRMIRIGENAESVALYGGEGDEKERLKSSFNHIWRTWWRLMKTRKRLTFFTAGYEQLAVIFPILAAAPRYFSGAIKLGGLTQTGVAFGQVQSSLSWFVNVYPDIAQWSASVNRLITFGEALVDVKQLPSHGATIEVARTSASDLTVDDLSLRLPDRRAILDEVSLKIHPSDRVVLTGPSGSGKSTLFRALAGIWPYGTGSVSLPRGRILFLPQKPYLPIATLREVLSYPDQIGDHDETTYRQALSDAHLAHLSDRLDEHGNWSLGLSGGEQQRIGFARAFLLKPDWLFMDEATSALDEPTEQALYAKLMERLPNVTLISVAHRTGVARFHTRRLTIQPHTKSLSIGLVTGVGS
ncbi:MAG: ABC transporter ATP-binding protein/permease [Desulfosarcinaceae bacterium]